MSEQLTKSQKNALGRLTRGADTLGQERRVITVTSNQALPQEAIDQFREKHPLLTVLTLTEQNGSQRIKVALRD